MRFRIWLVVLPLLGGCTRQPQIDCAAIQWPTLSKCFDEHRSEGEYAGYLACFPFSEPLKTEGTWVVGFEKNDFWEGRRPPPAEVLWNDSTGAQLWVDEKLYRPAVGKVEALQVEVVGRRAMCAVGPINPYPIIVQSLHIKAKQTRPA
jgi:hypothetical protein